jgi:flagellar hook-associated protein 2
MSAASITSAATAPLFQAGGLASGLDTNSIVDQLVTIESQPITTNNTKQAALTSQISSIGSLMSQIQALSTSAATLAKGVAATSVVATPSGISAVTGTGALPGQYSISVSSVASAAKARSTPFASSNNTVPGGNLSLTVQGNPYSIAIAANSDLGSVVQQINQSGAPVSAAVITDGTSFYVSLTNRQTGLPIGGAANSGLVVNSDPTGLGLGVTQNATNAVLSVDGLRVESQSNTVSTAIPGVTLTVKAQQPVADNLVISTDTSQSTNNVQSFVTAYNNIMTALQPSLRPDPTAGPPDGSVLDGSTAVGIEQQLQRLLSNPVNPSGAYQTLADIGISLQDDGTLALDPSKLSTALTNDPTAVNALFSTATTGVAATTAALSTSLTDPLDGQLVQRETSLQSTIKTLQTSNTQLQAWVDNFKQQLLTQFSNMETLISQYKTIGTFLTANDSSNSSSST